MKRRLRSRFAVIFNISSYIYLHSMILATVAEQERPRTGSPLHYSGAAPASSGTSPAGFPRLRLKQRLLMSKDGNGIFGAVSLCVYQPTVLSYTIASIL